MNSSKYDKLMSYFRHDPLPRQCMSVSLILGCKLDFSSCAIWASFCKSSHMCTQCLAFLLPWPVSFILAQSSVLATPCFHLTLHKYCHTFYLNTTCVHVYDCVQLHRNYTIKSTHKNNELKKSMEQYLQ